VDEIVADLSELIPRIKKAKENKEIVSIAYLGNVVDLWETLDHADILVELGTDQTSLHNPWAGGYYPVGLTLEESNTLMVKDPDAFKSAVYDSLKRQSRAIGNHAKRGTYFFDYGNAFLLEAGRAGADVVQPDGKFKYPSYVEDIMGPLCFDFGFGPFRWVCTSARDADLDYTDSLAAQALEEILQHAPEEICTQLRDNITWIKQAKANRLVVGSKARILYANAEARIKIAEAFNKAVRDKKIGPIVLGRDHHDVSGTDSPFRETANIRDGSQFTADMAIHNVIGDSFRGATWVSIHNGGGVGWGEVINGGFGLLLDGTADADRKLRGMLSFDVNNGIARRAWAGNENAIWEGKRALMEENKLKITLPNAVNDTLIEGFT
jgi:urocanate hydratase